MVLNALRRIFGRSHEGPATTSPAEAEIRLKALKARLAKNKSAAKRISSETEKVKHLDPQTKAANKQRLKELEAERKEIVVEMRALHRRLPKK